MNRIRALFLRLVERCINCKCEEPTEFGETYEAVRAEMDRVHAIREKAKANDEAFVERSRHYQQRAITLGQGRAGAAL